MEHTEYYQLSLWDADDRIMREDFNDNNAKLDTAVKAANDRIDTLGTSKANAAALGAETTARQNADTALGGRIDSEAQARASADSAEATARANADTALGGRIDSEAAARAAAVAAIGANLGAHGHNCRIAFGSYTGTGTYGSGFGKKTSLTFDFYPVLVVIQGGNYVAYAPVTMVRDAPKSNGADSSHALFVTWAENGVSWYSTSSENGAMYQMNSSSTTYSYVVLGYDKAAENA